MKALIGFAVFMVAVIGYVLNISSIIDVWNSTLTTVTFFRIIGIAFFPLGIVLGYI